MTILENDEGREENEYGILTYIRESIHTKVDKINSLIILKQIDIMLDEAINLKNHL